MEKFHTFEEFWLYYLREHSDPRTRAMHFAGTTLAILMIVAWIATGNALYLLLALAGSYGLAWISHFFLEHNKPATFGYPLWSLRADLLMYGKWLNGTLTAELKRANIGQNRKSMQKITTKPATPMTR
jgi:hypothetical protein